MSGRAPIYDAIGRSYAAGRRADPRIAAAIEAALGDAASVVNVGAGTGSYESADREVLAIEPSAVMRAQRPPSAAPCIAGVAGALPLDDASFDAATAFLTVHHWPDQAAGLRELRRVARRRVVILSWVADADDWWLLDYLPQARALDQGKFFTGAETLNLLASTISPARMTTVPIPADCADGFFAAYWRRPDAYLDPGVRAGISTFHLIDSAAGLARLADDLAGGRWAERNAALLDLTELDLGYRLFVSEL